MCAYQPARWLNGCSHSLWKRRCSQRFLQRQHRGSLPQYIYRIFKNWLDSLLQVLTDINEKAAAKGTKEAIEAAKKDLIAGKVHVFDVETFTVNGKKLDSYKADVDSDEAYTPDTEVIKDGYFHESEFRSAPYFDIDIDGINLI